MFEVLGVEIYEFFFKLEGEDVKIVFIKEDFYEKENFDLGFIILWIVLNVLKYEMELIIIEIMLGG